MQKVEFIFPFIAFHRKAHKIMSWLELTDKILAAKRQEKTLERQRMKASGKRPRTILLTSEKKKIPKRPVCRICATPHERIDDHTTIKKCVC